MKNPVVVAIAALVLASCSEGNGPNSAFSNVAVSFSTQAPAAQAVAPLFAMSDPITDDDGNTIDFTSAEIVLRDVQLERLNAVCEDNGGTDDDDCEELELGPVLVALPLGPTPVAEFEIEVEPGTYTGVEFKMHKVEDDDIAFLQQHPDFAEISIRVRGTFNGNEFEYTSDINDEQEFDLVPPVVIEDGMPRDVNLTVFVDLDAWFRDGSGRLVDPDTANKGEPNESLVNENIKQSFEAFEDDDRDGDDDSDDD